MPTAAYPDSSFVFSLVSKDSQSAGAKAHLTRASTPLYFTPLHRMEVRSALRNAVGRSEITEQECRRAFRLIEEDLRAGLFVHLPVGWTDSLRRADELSEKHASRAGQRSIDLLHVAIALEIG